MKLVATAVFVLLAANCAAQDLPSKPFSQRISDPLSPVGLGPFVRPHIDRNTFIPQGMVWWSDGRYWYARNEGSCDECGRPMTFRQAAFDRKALAWWGSAVAFEVGTAHSYNRCSGTCPFFRSFHGQLAFNMPILGLTWMLTAASREGNQSLHIGGERKWWVGPIISQALAGAFLIVKVKVRQ
jgi:hypothetical protein